MYRSWTNSVDRVCLTTFDRGIRVLAVAGARAGVGVSSLTTSIAEALCLSGRRTLLLDLSSPGAGQPVPDCGVLALATVRNSRGVDRMTVPLDARYRRLFSSTEHVRGLLDGELKGYSAIVIDLPPLLDVSGDWVNPVAAAAGSDGVLLVAMTSVSHREDLAAARSLLELGGARNVGVVMNDLAAPTLGAEVAREMRRIERYLPRFANWCSSKALESSILNRV